MAALTRVARSSIFPKRSWGAEEALATDEKSSISKNYVAQAARLCCLSATNKCRASLDRTAEPAAPMRPLLIRRDRSCWRCRDRFHDLGWQTEPYVLRHD